MTLPEFELVQPVAVCYTGRAAAAFGAFTVLRYFLMVGCGKLVDSNVVDNLEEVANSKDRGVEAAC